MKPYIIHPEAEFEATEAVTWYRERSTTAAAHLALEIAATIARIRSNPELFPKADRVHRKARVRHFPYSIFYRDQRDVIQVFAVAHGKRRRNYWAGRKV